MCVLLLYVGSCAKTFARGLRHFSWRDCAHGLGMSAALWVPGALGVWSQELPEQHGGACDQGCVWLWGTAMWECAGVAVQVFVQPPRPSQPAQCISQDTPG